MTDYSKLIFVNAGGDNEETASTDTLKFASFKTANYELTDTLLGKLANPVTTSSGATDSGKYPVLNASGLIDPSMIDHSAFEWQDSVKNIQTDATLNPGATPTTGDRYIITDKDNLHANFGTIAGIANQDIVQYSGTAFVVAYVPTVGAAVFSDADSTHIYVYSGSAWVARTLTTYTASLGVKLSSSDFQADLLANGGLDLSTNSLYVKTDNASIEKDGSGNLRVKADGINDLMVDWGTGTNQVSAVDVPIADAGGYTAQTEIEGALQEIYSIGGFEKYVTDASVNKGDLCYFSSNNNLSKMPISSSHNGVGLAVAAATSPAPVGLTMFGKTLTGVLTSATAGDKQYWTGTAISATMPSGGGSYVWQVGVAKNATDMLSHVVFLKKNA
jgi:hypothetical protein